MTWPARAWFCKWADIVLTLKPAIGRDKACRRHASKDLTYGKPFPSYSRR